MKQIGELTGRRYNLFDYVGAPDAERVIIIMGSGADAAEETVNYMLSRGEKGGPYQGAPVPSVCGRQAYRRNAKVREARGGPRPHQGARFPGEPLYTDVVAAFKENGLSGVEVFGGRYGLGSKEFTPSMVKAVYDNLGECCPKNHFTVGIVGRRYKHVAACKRDDRRRSRGHDPLQFFGLGSDGTVGANNNSIKIIGDHTDMYAQGYFAYDSKKSGGFTVSHLRFGKSPIQSPYLIDQADFIACHNPSYVTRYDVLEGNQGRRRVPFELGVDA